MGKTVDFLLSDDTDFTSERLPSLYSDFDTLKNINPDGFAANLRTWYTGLIRAIKAGAITSSEDRFVLRSGPNLAEALRTKEYGIPSAINYVIEESLLDNKLIPLDSFISSPKSIYDKSWLLMPWRFLQKGLQRWTSNTMQTRVLQVASYVSVEILEETANKIMAVLGQRQSRTDRVIPVELFKRKVCDMLNLSNISKDDFASILVFLSRDKHMIVVDAEVVKVRRSDNEENDISDTDREMVSVQLLESRLMDQVHELSESILEQAEAARIALSKKDKNTALRHLRRKKLQQELLTKREGMLHQVQDAWVKIEDAAGHVEFINAMKQTTSTLRFFNAKAGSPEEVDSIIDALNEEMMKTEDTSTAISTSSGGPVVDESEIDDELAALTAQNVGESQKNSSQTSLEEAFKSVGIVPQQLESQKPLFDEQKAGIPEPSA